MLPRRSLLAYGLFGLPLALVALPVYMYVPLFYAERFGLSLTLIGTVLLATRLFDAFIDPAIGGWIDRTRQDRGYGHFIWLSVPLLCIGFVALFHPPRLSREQSATWLLLALIVVYIGFSMATIAYQSWGAALTQAPAERSRISAARESCGLLGVIAAATVPELAGIGALTTLFIAALLLGAGILWHAAPRPKAAAAMPQPLSGILAPFRNRRFRWLFAVFVVNGIAAAIPATLFLFFARDRLQLAHFAGLFLLLYFIAAAASMPLWVALAKRYGEARTWLSAMLLSIAAFVWVYALTSGAFAGFGAICIMSGFALGADLALPPALLAAVIAGAGHSGRSEGVYFGAWNWATKINLALAAGISLPLLERLGYTPGAQEVGATQALTLAYAVLPCLLKLAAAGILWRAPLRDV